MTSPTSQHEVHKFIDLVYYYHNMSESCSYMLKPLTNIMYIKVRFNWTEVGKKAFD